MSSKAMFYPSAIVMCPDQQAIEEKEAKKKEYHRALFVEDVMIRRSNLVREFRKIMEPIQVARRRYANMLNRLYDEAAEKYRDGFRCMEGVGKSFGEIIKEHPMPFPFTNDEMFMLKQIKHIMETARMKKEKMYFFIEDSNHAEAKITKDDIRLSVNTGIISSGEYEAVMWDFNSIDSEIDWYLAGDDGNELIKAMDRTMSKAVKESSGEVYWMID